MPVSPDLTKTWTFQMEWNKNKKDKNKNEGKTSKNAESNVSNEQTNDGKNAKSNKQTNADSAVSVTKVNTPKAKNVNKDFCGMCERECKEGVSAMCCNSCELWFHLNCAGMDEEVYKILDADKVKGIMWFCQKCESSVAFALKTFNEVKKRQDEIEDKLNKVSDLLLENVKNTEQISERMDKIDNLIEVRVADYFKEREEKERKKLNIIIHGIPESMKKEPGDRKGEDTTVVKKIFSKLGVEAEVDNVIRLGKVVENGNRLTKVVLNDFEKKREILNNAKRLKSCQEFGRIFISPDMTREEREQDKKLRDEVKNKRDTEQRDGYKWVIKNRKVICLDPRGNLQNH